MISVNATFQIDFLGQSGSESLEPPPFSGTGSQADYVLAANRSKDGKSAKQRVQALVGIAHPKFRDELLASAKKMNLL